MEKSPRNITIDSVAAFVQRIRDGKPENTGVRRRRKYTDSDLGPMHWIRYRLEEEKPERSLVRVRLRFDAAEEALQFSLSFGADVKVLEPIELRYKARDAALGILQLYAQDSPPPGNRSSGKPRIQSSRPGLLSPP
jgi:predicted DNA-binding transcriptional regulator YafY